MACSTAGSWCPTQSTSAAGTPCSAGYYGKSSGAASYSSGDCAGMCTAGFYCPEGAVCANGATDAGACTIPKSCTGGFYCLAGSTTSDGIVRAGSATPCPIGSYSTGGASTPACTPCDAGLYGDATTQFASTCTGPCAAGYFCASGSTNAQGDVGSGSTPCALGYFCLAGSLSRDGIIGAGSATPCPIGSYSTGGASTPACTPCDAGLYGDATTQNASTCSGPCAPGYYCLARSSTGQGVVSTPTLLGLPTPCLAGTFSAGGASMLACTQCTAGRYGDATALTAATCTGPCAAGYYCLAGSTASQGKGVCPAGTYSGVGTGTTPDCTACAAPPGSHCPPGSVTETGTSCGVGSVCLGGMSAPVACVATQLWWGTGVEDFESSAIWEVRNTVTPAQNCTTAAHGSCSAFFSESFGRDFEGSLNIRGSMTAAGYSSAEFPYMCMCVLVAFAPGGPIHFLPHSLAQRDHTLPPPRGTMSYSLHIPSRAPDHLACWSYKIPAGTRMNMLMQVDTTWRSVSATQGSWSCLGLYSDVATWNPLAADDAWHYKCIDLHEQLQASLGPGGHTVSGIIWHDRDCGVPVAGSFHVGIVACP